MTKLSSSDIVAILRRFELADDDNVPRHIEQVRYSHPSPMNTLVTFRFNKHSFYVLIDDSAEDDESYVRKQLDTTGKEITGELLKNPSDHITTFALPFKGKEIYLFAVMSDKKRLDILLAERYPNHSRSTWQKYVKLGYVSVNGEVQTSSKQDVADTDSITIRIPDLEDFSKKVLPILYLDDNIIVINKPVGILTHTKGALNDEFTVAEFFRRYTSYGLESNRPGIVHRLDRDTSGVMIGARNDETAALLQKQFADRKTKKTYIAILEGIPKEDAAIINLPIGRNPSSPSTFRVDVKGKDAVTRYEIIATKDNRSLVQLTPTTGRTHQLRVHMAYIKTPIVGDRVYGTQADRLYLHALQLEITIPSGNRSTFKAPLPHEFTAMFPEI